MSEETDLPEPDATPDQFFQTVGTSEDGTLVRRDAERKNSLGETERTNLFQLTEQGKRNLMIALYGRDIVHEVEARFDTLRRGPDVRALIAEVEDWRARFAMLGLQYQEPSDEFLYDYIESATIEADRNNPAFPYGAHPHDWPPEVRTWFLAFTKALIQRLLGPKLDTPRA
jgi:hypothetical protein